MDGKTDRHLWSETYDRELKDVFAVQDEIANNIVNALELSLSPVVQRCITQRYETDDMDAYDYYLRGHYFVEHGDVNSGQQMFEKAIELDDNYALAWTGAFTRGLWPLLNHCAQARLIKKKAATLVFLSEAEIQV